MNKKPNLHILKTTKAHFRTRCFKKLKSR